MWLRLFAWHVAIDNDSVKRVINDQQSAPPKCKTLAKFGVGQVVSTGVARRGWSSTTLFFTREI